MYGNSQLATKVGFTLIELSIVLVIVGLLIGGILVGQSLSYSAKINAQVAQISQFDAGVSSFQLKFKFLPGDAPSHNGDGDGLIDISSGWCGSGCNDLAFVYVCEISRFWNHVFPQQYSAGSCAANIYTKAKGADKNVPAAKMGIDGAFWLASALSLDGRMVNVARQNYYFLAHPTQASGMPVFGAQFQYSSYNTASGGLINNPATIEDIVSLENKMDNGLANSGIVISGKIENWSGGGTGAIMPTALAACSTGAVYQPASLSGYRCNPLVRIGGSTGNPL